MESKPLEITFIPAPDDPDEDSEEYQAQLRDFSETLQNEGVVPSSTIELLEAAGHNEVTSYLGVFNVALGALGVVGTALGTWLTAKAGRKVSLKLTAGGDVEAEAQTVEDLERILAAVKSHQARSHHE